MQPRPTITILTDAEWIAASAEIDRNESSFGSISTSRGQLPLESMDIRARVAGLAGQVKLRQTFVNNLAAPLEATYIFPLPPRGAVTEIRLRIADREVVGTIAERGAARRSYDRAIQSGHRAAIAEEERSGVFTLRAGNIMPNEKVIVEMTLAGPLEIEGNTATFRFPLVVAPRYIPGHPLDGANVGDGVAHDTAAVPDASRISPPVLIEGYPNPVRLSLRVELDSAGLGIANLRSTLHSAVTSTRGNTHVIELNPGERLNRDFILRFDVGTDSLTTSAVAYPDADGLGGTFCLTAVPPNPATKAAKPRDVAFVLDRSGSMSGWKLVAARRAVARMIDSLSGTDRFSLIAFDNSIASPPDCGDALIAATDRNRYRAIEFLATLEARGGTEMKEPLVRAATQVGSGYQDRERVIVLVTDGQVGNEDQILAQLSTTLGARLFTVGIDRAVNHGFLRRLAALGAGSCTLVESEDRLDEAMDLLNRRIGEPILTEVSIAGDGVEVLTTSTVPHRLPDLFAACPAVIWGRYKGASRGAIQLSAVDSIGQPFRRKVSVELANREDEIASASGFAGSIWARGRIRALEDDYAVGRGDKVALATEITRLSLSHKVLSRFTAFLAVDSAEVVNAGGHNVRMTQPVEQPEGWADASRSALPNVYPQQLEQAAEALGGVDGFSPAPRACPPPAYPSAPSVGRAAASAPTPASFRSPSAPSAPPRPAPSVSPPASVRAPEPLDRNFTRRRTPSGAAARSGGKARASVLGRGQRSEEEIARPPSIEAAERRSLSVQIETLLARHKTRAWQEMTTRVARLVLELKQLLADLHSAGVDPVLVDKVRCAQVALEKEPQEIEELLTELLAAIRTSSGGNAQTQPRSGDFWR